jgi:hypothetical protein
MKNNIFKVKNVHLELTSLTVIGVELTYGINPSKILSFFFDFKVESVDLNNIFRAIMGFLGLAIYRMIGVFKPQHWWNATLTTTIFMGGLAFGRIISILIDGIPSAPFSIRNCLRNYIYDLGIYNLKTEKK